ncbi:MAG TPA: hypothetical protein VFO73_04765, partial [Candidatus Limnocylindrales bacterium]|nr:hypothetical protein [Candidatus Limnocylindrales bacterium]
MTLTTRPTRRPTPHVARIPAPAATSPTHAPPAGVLGGAPDLVDPEAILSLQQTAGNAATTALLRGDAGTPFVQRDEPRKASDATRPANPAGGWTGADTSGGGWNAGERVIGRMRRIPIQGLSLGKQSERNAANKALTE